MWKCDICHKVEVKEKGEGFRAFANYNVLTIMDLKGMDTERIDMWGICKKQIRICPKCLKKDYQDIKIN